ncbi:MAG: hypothetical protein QW423_00340 [Candidatus Aenigmatarchaeota archaeon]
MLKNIAHAKELSKKFKIPVEDILLIALNCSGINTNLPFKRIRFRLRLNSIPSEEFYLGLPVHSDSPFYLSQEKSQLFFNNNLIGFVNEVENDTCDSTYFRRNKTYLTLNSNSRSKCYGCKFCGVINQDPNDEYNLITKSRLINFLKKFLKSNNLKDFSHLVGVGICTGCFENEEKTLEHILLVRKVMRKFKFDKELIYIGSQITSRSSLDIIKENATPFSLSLALECFMRRKELLKSIKSKITLRMGRKILKESIERGFYSTIFYIIGLDSLEVVIKEFEKFLPYMNRFPVINLFQPYTSYQKNLRDPDAWSIEYYLEIRKKLEELFLPTSLRPRPWENYRPLWYLTFGNERINDIRI